MKLPSWPMLWFAFAGGIGYVVDAGVLLWASRHVGPYGGRLLSFCMAVLATWLINRHLAFRHARSGTSLWRELLRYFTVCLGGGAVNLAAYTLLVWALGLSGWWLLAAVAFGSLAGMTVNYSLSRRFVFARRKGDTAAGGR